MKKHLFLIVVVGALAMYLGFEWTWALALGVIAIVTLFAVRLTLSQTVVGRTMKVRNPVTGRLARKRRPERREDSVNDDTPAIVYVVVHRRLEAVKVGIGTDPGNRVQQHEAEGWQVFRVYYGIDRAAARAVEQSVLDEWKRKQIPFGAEQWELPQGGYTETAPLTHVHPAHVCEHIEKTLRVRKRRTPWSRARRVA